MVVADRCLGDSGLVAHVVSAHHGILLAEGKASVFLLAAGLGLPYTAGVLCKGRVTTEEIVFRLKRHWRFVESARP
jgi:hypothetical protein